MTFRRCLLLLLIVLSGVTATTVSTYYLYVSSHKEHSEQFSHKTIPYFGAISSNFQKSLDQVAAVQAYFQSAASVSREQFSTFASALISSSSGIQAIEWIPRVPHDRRASLESAAQFHGFSDFQFLEEATNGEMVAAAERLEYYPIYYIEPFFENEKTFGFDLASNAARKEAIVASRDSGEVVISRRITLMREKGKNSGVLAFEPVYRRDLPSQSVADRQKSIKGFVVGVFRISDIVDEALKRLPAFENARIQIFDRTDTNQVLYESQQIQSDQKANPDKNFDTAAYLIELPDENRKWEVVFSQEHLYTVLQMNGVTWFTLIVGLLMTSMMTVIVMVYMNRATVTAKLVEERTRELKISEKKAIRMAAEAEHSQREAEIANGAKSNFLATMSHEIRTPLNGVLGMAQLLKNSHLDKDQGKKVETILSSGRTLLAIINDVLDMSKIEAGGIELELTAFSLRNLISSVSTPFQSLADDKGVFLKVSDATNDLDILKGDPVRLRQIIWNLLSNAIKFTQEGQVTLTFTIVELIVDDEGQSKDTAICISITDTGTGISEDRLPYIFDAFTQEDTTITRKFGGSGLGLSIVKRLVDLMGGSITATSTLDEGTSFRVILPFDQASEVESKQLAHNNQPSTPEDATLHLKILLAEDNTVNAMIAEAFLKQFGHTVVVAENGLFAVSKMEEDIFDLILMDIHMPEMNGIDATKTIRKTTAGAKIPIIGLTAEAFADRHAMFRAAGMNDILTKPFTETQLREVLNRYGVRNGNRPMEQNQPLGHLTPSPELADRAYPIGNPEKLGEFKNTFSAEKTNQLLEDVVEAVDTRVEEMRQALTDDNLTGVTEAAHSIAGMSGSMFAVRLYEEAKIIESTAETVQAATELFPAFEKTVQDTKKWWLEEAKT